MADLVPPLPLQPRRRATIHKHNALPIQRPVPSPPPNLYSHLMKHHETQYKVARKHLGELRALVKSFPHTIPIVEIHIPTILEEIHGIIGTLEEKHDELEALGPSACNIRDHFMESLEFAWTTNMAIRPKPLTQRPIALDGPLSISICHARAACLPCEDLLKLLEYPTLQHMPSMCFQQYTPLIALLAENSLTGLELNVQHLQTLLGETQFDPLAFIDVALAVCWQWKEATSSEGRKTAADVRHDEDGAKNIAHLGKMICAISSLKIDEGFRYLYAPRYVLGAHVIYSTTAFEDSGSRYFRQEAADLLLPRAVREDPSDAEDPSETEDSDSQSDWSDDEEGPSEHWKLIPEWNLEDILRPTHSLTVDQLYYLPWSLVTLEWRRPPLDTKKRTEHERDSESTAFLQYHGEWLRTLSRQLQTHPVLHRGPVPTYSGVRRKSAVLPKLF